MSDRSTIVRRLHQLGAVNSFLGRAEVFNLHRVLRPQELIEYAICGWYESDRGNKGYGMLVATNQRMLMFDQVFTQRFVEDMPYDMLAEVDHGSGPLSGCLTVVVRTQKFCFKSIKTLRLQRMARLLEQKIQDYHFPGAANYGPSQVWNGVTASYESAS